MTKSGNRSRQAGTHGNSTGLRARAPDPVLQVARSLRDGTDTLRYMAWRSLADEPRLQRPIFLVGCPRSGTSVSVKLLATHPDLDNWSEAGRVWDRAAYDDPGADHAWGAERATEAEMRRLHSRFEHHRRRSGRPRFVNKHPRNSVRMDFIDRVFPDALYLHVIRDGRAVVNSIVSRTAREPYRQAIPFGDFCKPPGWQDLLREDPVEQAALQWVTLVRHVRETGARLDGRYLEYRYEDLCDFPRTVLADLFSFAGLRLSTSVLARLPERLWNENHKYRSHLSEDQIAVIERVGGDLLHELGYSSPAIA